MSASDSLRVSVDETAEVPEAWDSPITAALAPDECFLPRAEVERRVGMKRSAIYARMKEDKFPKPIRDEETASVWWLKSDIDAYIAAKISRARNVGSDVGNKKSR